MIMTMIIIKWGPDPPQEGVFLRGYMSRPTVTYLRMANVPAKCIWWTSAFTAARGDMIRRRCDLLPNYLVHLILKLRLILLIAET